ncbi:hypothetical protein YN1HA_20350 [Sulfurisphaera ohwakuensis]
MTGQIAAPKALLINAATSIGAIIGSTPAIVIKIKLSNDIEFLFKYLFSLSMNIINKNYLYITFPKSII